MFRMQDESGRTTARMADAQSIGARTSWSRSRVFAVASAAVCAYLAYQVFVARRGETVAAHGRNPTAVPLSAGRIGQSFVARVGGLSAIGLAFRSPSAVTVKLICELFRLEDGNYRSVYRWVEDVPLSSGRTAQRFDFPPVPDSRDFVFRFEVGTFEPDRAGVAVEAFTDDALERGNLIVNGSPQGGDLAIETQAAAMTSYNRFRMQAAQLPAILRSSIVQVCLMFAYAWALLVVTYYLIVSPEEIT